MARAWTCIHSPNGHGSFPQSPLMSISDRLGLERITCPVCLGMLSLGRTESFGWVRLASVSEIEQARAA